MITIDPEFKALIPPLDADEKAKLEENLKSWGGAREPLVVWGGTLLDGHNRYEICSRLHLPFRTEAVKEQLADKDDAKIWIIKNQLGRRNLPDYEKGRLAIIKVDLIAKKKANENLVLAGRLRQMQEKAKKQEQPFVNSQKAAPSQKSELLSLEPIAPVHRDEMAAKESGLGQQAISKIRFVEKSAPVQVKEAARAGDVSIHAAYEATKAIEKTPEEKRPTAIARIVESFKKNKDSAETKDLRDVVRDMKREEVVAQLEDVKTKEVKAASGVYDVVVLDPPWPMEKIERDVRPNQVAFDYPTMTEAELAALKVPCADDAHAFVWTTHKFLPMTLRLLDAWGLKYVCTFVWHKPGGFQPIGLPQYNCEFVVYAHRGAPKFVDTKAFFTCFEAPRGAHSEKPEEFYAVLRRVTAGRRLDMFNRRSIDGFDTWGNQAA